jgi:hypothetical protein
MRKQGITKDFRGLRAFIESMSDSDDEKITQLSHNQQIHWMEAAEKYRREKGFKTLDQYIK